MRGAFLVITGPTASGKTAFADEVVRRCAAEHISVEIINGDVGQFYAPLSIGTAKPDLRAVLVPHHLFDVLDQPVSFSAAAYRRHVVACIKQTLARNALPIVVGGSLFYLRSLFYPPQELDEREDGFSSVTDAELFSDEGLETTLLWQKLYEIDSVRAMAISKNDRYRIVRALTLWHRTGRLPSSCAPIFSPAAEHAFLIAITRERAYLNERINQRVVEMFRGGLLDEIAALGPQWWDFLCEKKLIGYHEVIRLRRETACVSGAETPVSEMMYQTMVASVQKNTRAYAKRQMTFLRAFLSTMRAHPEHLVVEANLTLSSDYLYIEQIVAWAKGCVPQCTYKGKSNG